MLMDRHKAKIAQPEALARLLAARQPPTAKVVMCHGVFDVVHPGHLRHLLYAKSKADILVASITSDQFTAKGPNRPHVPQDLRAANLALLDIVDYVVICDAEKPGDLILLLRPDFYAKGFEYSDTARAQPIEEAAAVEACGGQMLFTPGDVVYSSTALIQQAAPDLRWDKLEIVMRRADVTFGGLRAAVEMFSRHRVHVVGDAIVDSLLHCEMLGAQAKTPTISVRRDRREDFVGGAGVVAKHARAAGAAVQFTTVVGDDKFGLMVLDDAHAADIDVFPVVDRSRPTTVKEAVVVDGYRLLKIDTVDNAPISDALLGRMCGQVAETAGGSVVFSDFRHGIFNARTIPRLADAVPGNCWRVADSQVASRWGNIAEFEGFDLITPNEREARFALGDQDSGVRPLAARLCRAAKCKVLLMKMGQRGVLGFPEAASQEAGEDKSFTLDSFSGDVVDPVGAGDAFLAYATLGLQASSCPATAAILGSFAAGIECGYDGNVPVTAERVLAKIDEAEREVGK